MTSDNACSSHTFASKRMPATGSFAVAASAVPLTAPTLVPLITSNVGACPKCRVNSPYR
jgi:hypothetical protein